MEIMWPSLSLAEKKLAGVQGKMADRNVPTAVSG